MRGREEGEEERGNRRPEPDPRHLLGDHLLDLWLHVSVHCFNCSGENGDENQGVWELAHAVCLLPMSPGPQQG